MEYCDWLFGIQPTLQLIVMRLKFTFILISIVIVDQIKLIPANKAVIGQVFIVTLV